MSNVMLSNWMKAQKPTAPKMKSSPTFYRNLEEALDIRRRDHCLYTIKSNTSQATPAVDFSSNDTLSLGASGALRAEFDKELARYPNIPPGAGSSRVMDGNYSYIETVEAELASFHGAETGLFMGSGYEANLAIFSAIPRAGDVVVFDELVHASSHDGMVHSQATTRVPFRHNDVESFREVLIEMSESQNLVRLGKRCVIVAVESFYSMDGDICPLKELINVAREIFPGGNTQFLVDEAHSTGVVGPLGAGLVCELGLEKEVGIRLHTFGKALSASGAIILGNGTLKSALINLARPVIFTTAPSFPVVAAARAGYNLLKAGRTKDVGGYNDTSSAPKSRLLTKTKAQENVQQLVKFFLTKLTSNVTWETATTLGILSMPVSDDWEDQPFLTHIVPIWTRQRYSYWLAFHLHFAGFAAFPVEYPTVPKGQSRVRFAFHANNTEKQVDELIDAILEWATEMIEIEKGQRCGAKLPKAAKKVYAMMGDEDNID